VVSFYTADQLQVTTSPDFDLSLGVNLITGFIGKSQRCGCGFR
jgi:hypothetical protein